MFAFRQKMNPGMPSPADALPGRASPMPVTEPHFVNGHSLTSPYPDGMNKIIFGLGCFWGAERIFWQLKGVHVTAAGYAAGYTPNPTYEEGCLSVPNQFAEVDRPATCEVEFLDYNCEKKILKASGLLATCIQHEMDHLEGILFIDYLSKLKKSMIIKKLSKQKKSSEALVI